MNEKFRYAGKRNEINKVEIPMPFQMRCHKCKQELTEPALLTNTRTDWDGFCTSIEVFLVCDDCLQEYMKAQGMDESEPN